MLCGAVMCTAICKKRIAACQGKAPGKFEALLKKYDKSKDDRLSLSEFKKLASELSQQEGKQVPADDKLDQVFKKYDKNKSGTMNAEELEPAYAELQKLLQAGFCTTQCWHALRLCI